MPHPYSGTHARERAREIEKLKDGPQPCAICGKLMHYHDGPMLDYHHLTPLKLGGEAMGPKKLTHRKCNRAQGPELAAVGRYPKQESTPQFTGDFLAIDPAPVNHRHMCVTGESVPNRTAAIGFLSWGNPG